MPNPILRRRVLSGVPEQTVLTPGPTNLEFIGFASHTSLSPTIPPHIVGDLIVGNLSRTGTTPATPDAAEGWTQWEPTYSGNSHSSVFAWKIADSESEQWGNWVLGGRRCVWVFRNGVVDNHNGSTSASGTSLTWPSLSIAANSFVGAILQFQTAQVSVSRAAQGPNGVTTDRVVAPGGALVMDTDTSRLSSWSPGATRTLDTATTHVQTVFSVKKAP